MIQTHLGYKPITAGHLLLLITDDKSHFSTFDIISTKVCATDHLVRGSVHRCHLSGNVRIATGYQSLGILRTEMRTPLSRSSLVGNFCPRSSSFILLNKALSNGAKSGKYGWCGKTVYPRDARFFVVCLLLCGLALSWSNRTWRVHLPWRRSPSEHCSTTGGSVSRHGWQHTVGMSAADTPFFHKKQVGHVSPWHSPSIVHDRALLTDGIVPLKRNRSHPLHPVIAWQFTPPLPRNTRNFWMARYLPSQVTTTSVRHLWTALVTCPTLQKGL
jgi:hypothetical protein